MSKPWVHDEHDVSSNPSETILVDLRTGVRIKFEFTAYRRISFPWGSTMAKPASDSKNGVTPAAGTGSEMNTPNKAVATEAQGKEEKMSKQQQEQKMEKEKEEKEWVMPPSTPVVVQREIKLPPQPVETVPKKKDKGENKAPVPPSMPEKEPSVPQIPSEKELTAPPPLEKQSEVPPPSSEEPAVPPLLPEDLGALPSPTEKEPEAPPSLPEKLVGPPSPQQKEPVVSLPSPEDTASPPSPPQKEPASPPSPPQKEPASPPSPPQKEPASPPSPAEKEPASPPSPPQKEPASPPSPTEKEPASPPSPPQKEPASPPSPPQKEPASPPSPPQKEPASPPSPAEKEPASPPSPTEKEPASPPSLPQKEPASPPSPAEKEPASSPSPAEKEPASPPSPAEKEPASPPSPAEEEPASPPSPAEEEPASPPSLPEKEPASPPSPPEKEPASPPSPPEKEPASPPSPPEKEPASPPSPPEKEPASPPSPPEKEPASPPSPPEKEPASPPSPPEKEPASPPSPPEKEPASPPSPPQKEPASPPSPAEEEPASPPSPTEKEPASPPSPPQREPASPPSPTEKEPASPPSPTEKEPASPPSPPQREPVVPTPSPEELTAPPSPAEKELTVPQTLTKKESMFLMPAPEKPAAPPSPPQKQPAISLPSTTEMAGPRVSPPEEDLTAPWILVRKEPSAPGLPPPKAPVALQPSLTWVYLVPRPPPSNEGLYHQHPMAVSRSSSGKLAAVKERVSAGKVTFKDETPTHPWAQQGTIKRIETKPWMIENSVAPAAGTSKASEVVERQKEAATNKTMDNRPSQTLQASRSSMINSINAFVESPIGQVFATTIDRALDKSEEWLDYCLPLREAQAAHSKKSMEERDGDDLSEEGCFMRISLLSNKVRDRAFQYALQQLRSARKDTHANLSLLDQAFNLIENPHAPSLPNFPYVSEKLQNLWAQWNPRNILSSSKLSSGGPSREAITLVPEQLELKALGLTQTLAHQLYETYHNLLPHISELPAHLQGKVIQVYHNLEEIQSHFAKFKSLKEMPASLLSQSRAKMNSARETLDELLDFVASNPRPQWLSSAYAQRARALAATDKPPSGESPESRTGGQSSTAQLPPA
ncbi:basic proline-rich protein-like isoform X2 [Hemicordylus capensis]|uniref:basic proline-rich protein-like isoform X2 n=1 Tax=Hemicordylus capensis TaxID=884348 RepID=UPI002303A5BC|nr:basic proline-rich protein-like isoform X2 [Hemicordylus capensis]